MSTLYEVEVAVFEATLRARANARRLLRHPTGRGRGRYLGPRQRTHRSAHRLEARTRRAPTGGEATAPLHGEVKAIPTSRRPLTGGLGAGVVDDGVWAIAGREPSGS